jgi:hypothetical protein
MWAASISYGEKPLNYRRKAWPQKQSQCSPKEINMPLTPIEAIPTAPTSLGSLERLPRELLVDHILPHVFAAGPKPVDRFMGLSSETYRLVVETAMSLSRRHLVRLPMNNKLLGSAAMYKPPQIPVEVIRTAQHVINKVDDHPVLEYARSDLNRRRYSECLEKIYAELRSPANRREALGMFFEVVDKRSLHREVCSMMPFLRKMVGLYDYAEEIQNGFVRFLSRLRAHEDILYIAERYLYGGLCVDVAILAHACVGLPPSPEIIRWRRQEIVWCCVFETYASRRPYDDETAKQSSFEDLLCLSANIQNLSAGELRDKRVHRFLLSLLGYLKNQGTFDFYLNHLRSSLSSSMLTLHDLKNFNETAYGFQKSTLFQFLPFYAKCSGDIEIIKYALDYTLSQVEDEGIPLDAAVYFDLLGAVSTLVKKAVDRRSESSTYSLILRLNRLAEKDICNYKERDFIRDEFFTAVHFEHEYFNTINVNLYRRFISEFEDWEGGEFRVLEACLRICAETNSRGQKLPDEFAREMLTEAVCVSDRDVDVRKLFPNFLEYLVKQFEAVKGRNVQHARNLVRAAFANFSEELLADEDHLWKRLRIEEDAGPEEEEEIYLGQKYYDYFDLPVPWYMSE